MANFDKNLDQDVVALHLTNVFNVLRKYINLDMSKAISSNIVSKILTGENYKKHLDVISQQMNNIFKSKEFKTDKNLTPEFLEKVVIPEIDSSVSTSTDVNSSTINSSDSDGHVFINEKELAEYLETRGGVELFGASTVKEVLDMFDKDNTGTLDENEMNELNSAIENKKKLLSINNPSTEVNSVSNSQLLSVSTNEASTLASTEASQVVSPSTTNSSDSDGLVSIDEKELAEYLETRGGVQLFGVSTVKEVLNMFDKDNTGTLDENEMNELNAAIDIKIKLLLSHNPSTEVNSVSNSQLLSPSTSDASASTLASTEASQVVSPSTTNSSDSDGLVSIDETELAEYLETRGGVELFGVSTVKEVLNMFDKDNTGTLDENEMNELNSAIENKKKLLSSNNPSVSNSQLVSSSTSDSSPELSQSVSLSVTSPEVSQLVSPSNTETPAPVVIDEKQKFQNYLDLSNKSETSKTAAWKDRINDYCYAKYINNCDKDDSGNAKYTGCIWNQDIYDEKKKESGMCIPYPTKKYDLEAPFIEVDEDILKKKEEDRQNAYKYFLKLFTKEDGTSETFKVKRTNGDIEDNWMLNSDTTTGPSRVGVITTNLEIKKIITMKDIIDLNPELINRKEEEEILKKKEEERIKQYNVFREWLNTKKQQDGSYINFNIMVKGKLDDSYELKNDTIENGKVIFKNMKKNPFFVRVDMQELMDLNR